MRYNLVISYKKKCCDENGNRLSFSGCEKYKIYKSEHGEINSNVILKTNSKYELKIWMDLNGYELGKRCCDKDRCKNFDEFFGLAINLRKK